MKKKYNPIVFVVFIFLAGFLYRNRNTLQQWAGKLFHKEVSVPSELEEKADNGIVDEEVLQFMHDSLQSRRKSDAILNARLEQIRTLYLRDKEIPFTDPVTMPESTLCPSETTYTIEDAHLTEDFDSLCVEKDALAPFDPHAPAYDENGEKRDGWTYLSITVRITNTGNTSLDQYFLYGFAPYLYFLDEEGEEYYELNSPNYCTFQPGNTTQHAFYYADFEAGSSFENTYILTVPKAAVSQKTMVLIWNPDGVSTYPTENYSLINLGGLK